MHIVGRMCDSDLTDTRVYTLNLVAVGNFCSGAEMYIAFMFVFLVELIWLLLQNGTQVVVDMVMLPTQGVHKGKHSVMLWTLVFREIGLFFF